MREYTKPVKKKTTEKAMCQYCLDNTKDKTEYVWVDNISCYELACLDCVEKNDLIISKPYFISTKKVKEPKTKPIKEKKVKNTKK